MIDPDVSPESGSAFVITSSLREITTLKPPRFLCPSLVVH